MKISVALLIFVFVVFNDWSGEKELIQIEQPIEYTWEKLNERPVPEWFDDAKFGIMIHWGPYSVLGNRKSSNNYAEWTPHHMYQDTAFFYKSLRETYGACPPEFGYKDIIPLFKAENWNPDDWADLFHEAGAKYVTITAEHHDGFAMWDSDITEWCATKKGPMRDLVGDLGQAVRKKDMKYVTTYHRERHPGYFAKKLYVVNNQPVPDIAKEIRQMPEAAGLYGPFEFSDSFINDYVARWKELQQKYKPDFLWIDDVPLFYKEKESINHPQTLKFKAALLQMVGDYFAAADKWGKEVYLNNKGKNRNWPEGPGVMEMDNLRLDSIAPKWQNPATLGTSYGYAHDEEVNDAYKSPRELIHLLCDVVSKNGNLLLNIGPKADGTIPEGMQKRLLEIGKWLKVNGEAIYGTRPWVTFKQDHPDLRFTKKPDALYAISLEKHEKPFVINLNDCLPAERIIKVTLLSADEDIDWTFTEKGIKIIPPKNYSSDYAWVFKISTKTE